MNFWEHSFEILDEVLFKSRVLCVDMLWIFLPLLTEVQKQARGIQKRNTKQKKTTESGTYAPLAFPFNSVGGGPMSGLGVSPARLIVSCSNIGIASHFGQVLHLCV